MSGFAGSPGMLYNASQAIIRDASTFGKAIFFLLSPLLLVFMPFILFIVDCTLYFSGSDEKRIFLEVIKVSPNNEKTTSAGRKINHESLKRNTAADSPITLFYELDVDRILRPLKTHVKSIPDENITRLESNLSYEITALTERVNNLDKERAEELKEIHHRLDALEAEMRGSLKEIISLLKNPSK